MKFLLLQSSPNSCHFIPLMSKMLISALFSDILNQASSVSVLHQVSHPYKKIGKIMGLYILFFKLLQRRREDIDSCEYVKL